MSLTNVVTQALHFSFFSGLGTLGGVLNIENYYNIMADSPSFLEGYAASVYFPMAVLTCTSAVAYGIEKLREK